MLSKVVSKHINDITIIQLYPAYLYIHSSEEYCLNYQRTGMVNYNLKKGNINAMVI